MLKKIIYLSMQHAEKRVNLCYKELAVRICIRTEDTDTGKYSFDYVNAKEALKLVASGEVEVHANSETKTNLSKVASKLFDGIPLGRKIDLNKKMKVLADSKGDTLNWLEKVEQYLKFTGKRWNKTGIRI
ncbi:hypothetical protein [Vibrio sp. 10N.239.312.D08]|uniref:hypothetical protein n=1 Tax=Vibrio sp. 10N.239.312.D08 TaxID=3229978 RepID=UPI00355375B8